MVDLEFDTASETEAVLAAMRVVRRRAHGDVVAREYGSATRPR
jgi:hypothetical protein